MQVLTECRLLPRVPKLQSGSGNRGESYELQISVYLCRTHCHRDSSGHLTSHADDIIWSTANSPVILTQGDAVFKNERLIIEPGVTVEGNGHKIQVFGELQGIGISAAPIFLNNVVIVVRRRNNHAESIELRHCHIRGGQLHDPAHSSQFVLTDCRVVDVDQIIYIGSSALDCVIERNEFIDSAKIRINIRAVQCRILNNLFFTTKPRGGPYEPFIESTATYMRMGA